MELNMKSVLFIRLRNKIIRTIRMWQRNQLRKNAVQVEITGTPPIEQKEYDYTFTSIAALNEWCLSNPDLAHKAVWLL